EDDGNREKRVHASVLPSEIQNPAHVSLPRRPSAGAQARPVRLPVCGGTPPAAFLLLLLRGRQRALFHPGSALLSSAASSFLKSSRWRRALRSSSFFMCSASFQPLATACRNSAMARLAQASFDSEPPGSSRRPAATARTQAAL